MFRQNPLLGYWARGLENLTASERAIEPAIASFGERYRCQHAFMKLKYFADFAFLDRKVIIEVDGASHNNPAQMEKDLLHTLAVLELGWTVVRVTNDEASQTPAKTVAWALEEADYLKTLDTASRVQVLTDQLGQLRQSYPHLLAAAAKRATKKSQRSKVAARTRASSKVDAAPPRRKRAASAPLPQ